VQGDLADERLMASMLPDVDVVFHLATATIPQSSNDSPVFDIQENLIRTVRLLEACVKHRVKKVVFLSSGGTVYGPPQSLPISEDHPTNPICSHGVIKLAIEKYFHLFHHLHGLSYTILRPSNPYGGRQNPGGRLGAISIFLGRIADGHPVTIWGTGEVVRDYFHVSDLARACIAAATTRTESFVFNVGSGCGISLNSLLEVIATVVRRPFRVVRQPPRAFDVERVVLDVQRAHNEMHWTPVVSLEEGIDETWKWVCWLGKTRPYGQRPASAQHPTTLVSRV
jgi:UDP-glucose 4-epimerase